VTATVAPGSSVLRAERITKWFGSTHANDAVDLDLIAGEVHGLLGQNGAGKSTLIGIMTGRYAPDSGRIVAGGDELPSGDPRSAVAHGIATVFQDLVLVPSMTGLENIAVGLGVAATRETRERVLQVQEEYDLPAKLDVVVHDLEVPERQRIELLRALCQAPRALLLDEPTSLLPPTRVAPFLAGVKRLTEHGLAVLLITHRLQEARSICDRITILRQGRVVAAHTQDDFPSNDELAIEMLGTAVVEHFEVGEVGPPQLDVRELTVRDALKHVVVESVSFDVRQGEIVGLAGVDGNGQVELLEAIAGLRPPYEGCVLLHGEDITSMRHERRFHSGIVIVSGDRRRHEIVPELSVAEHFEYVRGSIRPDLQRLLEDYNVRPPTPSLRGDSLSGGNQQKMIMARACDSAPKVLLASYPTQGLDVQASVNIRELLLDRARKGSAIIVSSSDLDEVLSISHRVIVMNHGRIMGVMAREEVDRRKLAAWLAGDAAEAAA
jgi:simple sugar transport system ATP-binding protein